MANVRKSKLPKPAFQFRLAATFLGIAALALLLQSLLFARRLTELANEIRLGGNELRAALPGMLLEILVFSLLVLLPLLLALGALLTFRIAGPIYRFETYLGQVADGTAEGPCRIREGDQLQLLCERINAALEAERARAHAGPADEPGPSLEAA